MCVAVGLFQSTKVFLLRILFCDIYSAQKTFQLLQIQLLYLFHLFQSFALGMIFIQFRKVSSYYRFCYIYSIYSSLLLQECLNLFLNFSYCFCLSLPCWYYFLICPSFHYSPPHPLTYSSVLLWLNVFFSWFTSLVSSESFLAHPHVFAQHSLMLTHLSLFLFHKDHVLLNSTQNAKKFNFFFFFLEQIIVNICSST